MYTETKLKVHMCGTDFLVSALPLGLPFHFVISQILVWLP